MRNIFAFMAMLSVGGLVHAQGMMMSGQPTGMPMGGGGMGMVGPTGLYQSYEVPRALDCGEVLEMHAASTSVSGANDERIVQFDGDKPVVNTKAPGYLSHETTGNKTTVRYKGEEGEQFMTYVKTATGYVVIDGQSEKSAIAQAKKAGADMLQYPNAAFGEPYEVETVTGRDGTKCHLSQMSVKTIRLDGKGNPVKVGNVLYDSAFCESIGQMINESGKNIGKQCGNLLGNISDAVKKRDQELFKSGKSAFTFSDVVNPFVQASEALRSCSPETIAARKSGLSEALRTEPKVSKAAPVAAGKIGPAKGASGTR